MVQIWSLCLWFRVQARRLLAHCLTWCWWGIPHWPACTLPVNVTAISNVAKFNYNTRSSARPLKLRRTYVCDIWRIWQLIILPWSSSLHQYYVSFIPCMYFYSSNKSLTLLISVDFATEFDINVWDRFHQSSYFDVNIYEVAYFSSKLL